MRCALAAVGHWSACDPQTTSLWSLAPAHWASRARHRLHGSAACAAIGICLDHLPYRQPILCSWHYLKICLVQRFASVYEQVLFTKFFGNANDNTKHIFTTRFQIPKTPTFLFLRQGTCIVLCLCRCMLSPKAHPTASTFRRSFTDQM